MDKQTVQIHGKTYEIVASRVNRFRKDHPTWNITTEVIEWRGKECIIKAFIIDDKGVVRATGIAHEKEEASNINRTSYIECCESSAIGRALACFNYQGGEYASADEVANAITNQDDRATLKKVVDEVGGTVVHTTKLISEKQGNRLWAIGKGKKIDENKVIEYIFDKYGYNNPTEIEVKNYDAIVKWVESQ